MNKCLYKVISQLSVKSGDVCSAACTCPAVIGLRGFGNCNHVGGVFFALEDFNRRGLREEMMDNYCYNTILSQEEISNIEKSTHGQASNDDWKKHHGEVTYKNETWRFEIKCPFSEFNMSLQEALKNKKFFLVEVGASPSIDEEQEEARSTKEPAQTGLLAQENPYGSIVPLPPQPHFFQRDNSSYSMTGITNQAVSTHSQFNKTLRDGEACKDHDEEINAAQKECGPHRKREDKTSLSIREKAPLQYYKEAVKFLELLCLPLHRKHGNLDPLFTLFQNYSWSPENCEDFLKQFKVSLKLLLRKFVRLLPTEHAKPMESDVSPKQIAQW
eukprot:gene5741-10998_t